MIQNNTKLTVLFFEEAFRNQKFHILQNSTKLTFLPGSKILKLRSSIFHWLIGHHWNHHLLLL